MKRSNFILKIIFLLIIPLLTMKCSSDDNFQETNNNSTPYLTNTINDTSNFVEDLTNDEWTATNLVITGNMNLDTSDTEMGGWVFSNLPFLIESKNEILDYSVNFSKEPNLIEFKGILSATYVATINDYVNTYEYSKILDNIDFFIKGNWTLGNGTIVINNNDGYESYTILEASRNKLIIIKKIKDDALIPISYQSDVNFNFIANLDITLTLEKK